LLKKTITYENFDGERITEEFYFNLTQAELVELEVSTGGEGFAAVLQQIVKAKDGKGIIENLKKIILMSYGEKSPDGKRFIKTQEMRDSFASTEAYSELFVELSTNAQFAADFINGVVPKALQEKVRETEKAQLSKDELVQAFKAKAEETVELPADPPVVLGQVEVKEDEYGAFLAWKESQKAAQE
jgi:hypothetical protein